MSTMLGRYEALVKAGELRPDPEQAAAAARLDLLQAELESAEAGSRGFRLSASAVCTTGRPA